MMKAHKCIYPSSKKKVSPLKHKHWRIEELRRGQEALSGDHFLVLDRNQVFSYMFQSPNYSEKWR